MPVYTPRGDNLNEFHPIMYRGDGHNFFRAYPKTFLGVILNSFTASVVYSLRSCCSCQDLKTTSKTWRYQIRLITYSVEEGTLYALRIPHHRLH